MQRAWIVGSISGRLEAIPIMGYVPTVGQSDIKIKKGKTMNKPRWDAPHLTPLRYDYQLLRDAYKSTPKRALYYLAFAVGFALWVLGFLGVELLVMR